MQLFKKISLTLLATMFLMRAGAVSAASIFAETETAPFHVGSSYVVDVFLDTENEDVNAVEGTLVFPAESFDVEAIRDGNSTVTFWIQRPQAGTGKIAFSGIIPGGHVGEKSFLFSVVVRPLRAGVAFFQVQEEQILLHDGKGTQASANARPLILEVAEQVVGEGDVTYEKADLDAPETFVPVVSRDPNMFEGKYFLVFATQDKASGIDHYEVREGGGAYVTAESPYLLQNQNVNEDISVKAVDKKGHARVATVFAAKKQSSYQKYATLAMMVLIGFLLGRTLSRVLSRRKQGS
ncbi:MAG: hypothetical protein WC866_02555 [Patescibacteria group bacterium]|jgi:hypothetical protein